MKKPLIVLSPQAMPMEAPFQSSYHFTNRYNIDAIRRAGGLPVLSGFLGQEEAEALLQQADGLFLTGGGDLSPALYGETPKTEFDELDPERDASDYCLLTAALKLHKPILCICRGFQLVNVYLGGTLYQDVPSQYQTDLRHSNCDYPDYTRETAHTVRLVEGTPLQRLLGETEFPVNSLHHQAVCQLAPCLKPMAYATDGILVNYWTKFCIPVFDQTKAPYPQ